MGKDILDKYFDENFFVDMVEDFCNMDIKEELNDYIQKLIVSIFNIMNYESNFNKMDENSFKKIYNCQKIDYANPIKYSYFKEISKSTIPLLKLNLLIAELSIYSQIIKDTYNIPISFFVNFNVQEFILYTLGNQISDVLSYGTKKETLNFLKDKLEYNNMFKNVESSINDYWFWINMYDMLKETCLRPLKNMVNLSQMYAWETFKITENKQCIYNSDEELKKENKNLPKQEKLSNRTAHNAYTREELLIIYQAKITYKSIINMYKLSRFLIKTITQRINYIKALDNIQKLPLDEELSLFRFGLEELYTCNFNCTTCKYRKGNECLNINNFNLIDKLKAFANKHMKLVYNHLFKDQKSIVEIQKKIESISKQEIGLTIIKEIYPFFEDKTNKTITNIFSLKNVIEDEEEYYQNFKKVYYEKQHKQAGEPPIINALNTIGDSFELYLQEPTQERKVFLMMNLKQVQMSLNL